MISLQALPCSIVTCNTQDGIYYFWFTKPNEKWPYIGMSLDPKRRFANHKSFVNNYVAGSKFNSGLQEKILELFGSWPLPEKLHYMIIDKLDFIPGESKLSRLQK